MTPKFDTWYIQIYKNIKFDDGTTGSYPEFSMFFKVGNKWVAYNETHHGRGPWIRATWFYEKSDFQLEPLERLATQEEISKYKLNSKNPRRETIKYILREDKDDE